MNKGRYIFSQLCDFLPTDHFKWLVKKYEGNKSVKNVKVAKIIEILQSDGWYQVRCRGNHREFHHPTKKGTVTVNSKPNGTICGFVLKSIERQSGLNF